jgi:hypothetical protein
VERRLIAKSSDGQTNYEIQFVYESGKLSVFCNCPAGAFGKYCKHKLSFLNGEKVLLTDTIDLDSFSAIREWVRESGYPPLLAQVDLAETEVKIAQSRVQDLKKKLERAMKEGV